MQTFFLHNAFGFARFTIFYLCSFVDAKVGTIFKGHERSLAERKLRDRILQGYEKPIMPNGNNSEIFLLSMGMVLTVIQEVVSFLRDVNPFSMRIELFTVT